MCRSGQTDALAHPPHFADPVDVALAVVDRALRLVRMDGAAAARIGLDGLHVCAGHPFAVQLWLAGASGVHALEALSGLTPDPLAPPGAERADLLVRHFPSPETDAFAALSPDERAIRRGDGFHASGAPDRGLTRDLFGTPLFGAGLLRLSRDPAGHTVAVQAVSGTAAGLTTLRPVLDAVVTLLAFAHRTQPAAVVIFDGPGTGRGLHVVLPVDPPPSAVTAGASRPAIPLACFIAAAESAGRPAAEPAPPRWWQAATWPTVPQAAPCACHGGSAHHGRDHEHTHDQDHARHGPRRDPGTRGAA